MRACMTRTCNCLDNAPMETCRGILKTELMDLCPLAIREQARHEVTQYSELFHNRTRKQAQIGYLSSAGFNHLVLIVAFIMPFSSPLCMPLSKPFIMPISVFPSALTPLMVFVPIAGNINFVIPTILHKIDRAPACIILAAMFSPVLGVPGGNAQIQRLVTGTRFWPNHNWLSINQLWLRETTYLQTAIITRLPYGNHQPHIRSMARRHK